MKKRGLLSRSRALSKLSAGKALIVRDAKRIVVGFALTSIVFAAGCELPPEASPSRHPRHDLPYEWSTPPVSFQRELYDEYHDGSRSRSDWHKRRR